METMITKIENDDAELNAYLSDLGVEDYSLKPSWLPSVTVLLDEEGLP